VETITRRTLLNTVSAAAGASLAGAAQKKKPARAKIPGLRSHPLDGIQREKLKITDVTLTLLSAEIPKERLVSRSGYMDLPDRPGFGVELAADLPKKFPYLPGRFDRPNPDLPALSGAACKEHL